MIAIPASPLVLVVVLVIAIALLLIAPLRSPP